MFWHSLRFVLSNALCCVALTRCTQVLCAALQNLRRAQAHDRGAALQKSKIKASVSLLVKGYCTPVQNQVDQRS